MLGTDARLDQPARDLIKAVVGGIAARAGSAPFSWQRPGTSLSYLGKRSHVDRFDETNIDAAWQALNDAGLMKGPMVTPPKRWRDQIAREVAA